MMNGIEILKAGIENRDRGQELTLRQKKNRIRKDIKQLEDVLKQPKVRTININIEWKKSKTWGSNPNLSANITTEAGFDKYSGIKASGCGYDKESTVIADLLNHVMKNELLSDIDRIIKDQKNGNLPYGIATYGFKDGFLPCFEGAVGVNCYYGIMEYLGYDLKRVASGESFDVYQIIRLDV